MNLKPVKNIFNEAISDKIYWIWVGTYLTLSIIFYNYFNTFRPRPNYGYSVFGRLLGGLSLFDASSYLLIAKQGYLQTRLSLPAFFPLYPLLINIFSWPLRIFLSTDLSIILAGTLINIVSLSIALSILSRLINLDYTNSVTKYAKLILLLFPFSFFFLSFYTESLFLLLIVSSFYAARKNRWLLACVIAGLASAVRLPGLILIPTLIIEFLNQSNFSFKKACPRVLWILLAPLGAIIYFAYLNFYAGGISKYFEAYKICWPDRKFTVNFLSSIYNPVFDLLKYHSIRPNDVLGLATIMIVGFTIYLFYKYKVRLSYAVFSIMSFLLPLFTGTLESVGRYYMVVFPMIICLGVFFSKNRKLFWFYIIPSAIASIALMMFFIRGVFVG